MGVYDTNEKPTVSYGYEGKLKPISAYTTKELLKFLGITSTVDEYFRNYNYDDFQRREHLLKLADARALDNKRKQKEFKHGSR